MRLARVSAMQRRSVAFDELDDNEKKKGPDMTVENDVLENKNE